MTRQEFEEKVSQLKPPVSEHGIQESYMESCVHLAEGFYVDRKGDCWEVYYSERGGKRVLATFPVEGDAYDYLYLLLKQRSGKYYVVTDGYLKRSELIAKLKKLKILKPEADDMVASIKGFLIEEKEDVWNVVSDKDGDSRMLGVFFDEYDANAYVFYLLTKDRVETKKHWWQKLLS